ncbi:NK2 homeobox 4b [Austrofundulus limnaeus]|uniref:NK2 homeobox 4b n=1 Tax=Austrofundulus limnaeus TaxID=52670 RepID=A0A2I4C093_AUSLI|nr:PREDICTED: homeobox protein Nkx-2.4-like [Austrofundulus limnaeus]
MSLSPKQSRFSVSDLLGSGEDGYRRFGGMDCLGTALGTYRQQQQVSQTGIQNQQNYQNQQQPHLHHHHHHHHHHLSSSSSSSAPLGPIGTYRVAQFSGSVGFCNGGTEQSYQEPGRGGAGSAWFGGPEPRFSQSKNRSEPQNRTRT